MWENLTGYTYTIIQIYMCICVCMSAFLPECLSFDILQPGIIDVKKPTLSSPWEDGQVAWPKWFERVWNTSTFVSWCIYYLIPRNIKRIWLYLIYIIIHDIHNHIYSIQLYMIYIEIEREVLRLMILPRLAWRCPRSIQRRSISEGVRRCPRRLTITLSPGLEVAIDLPFPALGDENM